MIFMRKTAIFFTIIVSLPILIATSPVFAGDTGSPGVERLRCEYRINPAGIDICKPRLSWEMISESRGEIQTAYQVLVASSEEQLTKEQGDLWDSGKVKSSQSVQIEYAGKSLQSRMQCFWKVRVWDKDGKETAWSRPALWTMGLLQPGDWKAKWIGLDLKPAPDKEEADIRSLPARYLRKEFTSDKKVARATAYVSGLGFFDLYLNGQKVSDAVMNPALSDYRKAVYYLTFDITSLIKDGKNALGVVLGSGRYFAPRLRTPAPTVTYGYPKLLLQTEIQYEDGATKQIISDENWKLTTNGPIRSNNEYDGEEYDARLEMKGWNQTGYDDTSWEKPQLVTAPAGNLLAQIIEPMRITETVKPVGVSNPQPGVYIIDMGQAFYGTFRLKASGPRDATVAITSAYSLLPDGMLKTADNRGARATDIYTFKGEGEEIWSPSFTGQGYRRLQVKGFPGTPTIDNFEGLVIHSDVEPIGQFACSNDLVNRIHSAMRWGFPDVSTQRPAGSGQG